jgi:hypothetical protein
MAPPNPKGVKFRAVEVVVAAAKDFRDAASVDKIQAADVDKIHEAVERVRKGIDVVKVQAVAAEVFAAAEALQALVTDSTNPQDPVKIQAAVKKVRLAASNKLPAVVAEDEKLAHRVAANLLSINENNPLHKSALDDWLQTQKGLFESLSRRQARSADLTNQIYNIIGWFAVFQGVVLTAVTQMTQTHTGGKPLCGKIWFPIVLTCFGTAVTATGVFYKFRGLKSLELTIHTEKEAIIVCSSFPSICSHSLDTSL